jgi:sodium/hydrogen exchanger 8
LIFRLGYEWACLLTLAILATIFIVNFAESRHFHLIPESGLVILVGVACSAILRAAGFEKDSYLFNLDIFNYILLPIIIFESGYSLKKRGIFRNFGTIMAYAFLGTAVACIITAWAMIEYAGIKDMQEALLYGALISATDPVATLAVFKQVFGLDEQEYLEAPLIYDLVLGESVLNDAVAIVLYHNFEITPPDRMDIKSIVLMVLNFVYVALGSTAVGVIVGLLMSLLFKHSSVRSNVKFDLTVIVFGAYLSYFLSAMINFSGLFSIFFYGIVCGHYTWYNMSAWAQLISERYFTLIILKS